MLAITSVNWRFLLLFNCSLLSLLDDDDGVGDLDFVFYTNTRPKNHIDSNINGVFFLSAIKQVGQFSKCDNLNHAQFQHMLWLSGVKTQENLYGSKIFTRCGPAYQTVPRSNSRGFGTKYPLLDWLPFTGRDLL